MHTSGRPSSNQGWLRAIETEGAKWHAECCLSLMPDRIGRRARQPGMLGQLLVQHQRIGRDHDAGRADERQLAAAQASAPAPTRGKCQARCTRKRLALGSA